MKDAITRKLYKLHNLYKALGNSLQPTKPTMPEPPKTPKVPTMQDLGPGSDSLKALNKPTTAPKSKKNPTKVQEQFSTKPAPAIMKGEDVYHLHVDGNQITHKPMTLKEINVKHGGVPKLEASGVRVVKV